VLATAITAVSLKPVSNTVTVIFSNQVFKVLDKNLETLHAIAYDTVRRPNKNETLELFFYVKESQKVKIDLYTKVGKSVKSFGEKTYPKGANRLALELPLTLPTGTYYAYFDCTEFKKSVLFVIVE
jgi:hypothetical protein